MARRTTPTLAEVAVTNLRNSGVGPIASVKKASDALGTAVALAIAALRGAATDGGWPTQAEYATYWKITERTAQREWALFRQAFPNETSPDRLARWLTVEYRRRLEQGDTSLVLSLPADALALA